jgi:hypothetical protein
VSEPDSRRASLGRVLDGIGLALLPGLAGLAVGFYLSDRGVRLVPTLVEVCLGGGLLGLSLIGVGRWLSGDAWAPTPAGRRLRKRVAAVIALGVVALAARLGLHFAEQPSALTRLSAGEFEAAFAADRERLCDGEDAMGRLVDRLEAAGVPAPAGVLSPDQERKLAGAFASLRDHAIALDELRMFWEDWWRFDPSRIGRPYHLKSFLLTFAAELGLYETAARFSKLVLNNPNAQKFLDAPHPEHGLEAGSFSRYRELLLGARDQARVLAGEQYLRFLAEAFGARDEAKALGLAPLWDRIEATLRRIETRTPIERGVSSVRADGQLLKRGVRRAWFPMQKQVAELMGDTRVRRIGTYLIDHELQRQAAAKLRPGDVMLSRKNWYLSNVGLPGFWPHALFWVGEPGALDAHFVSEPVRAWLREQAGREASLTQLLAERHPGAVRRWREGEASEPYVVLEAISEGVVPNTFDHAAGDYLAALRPRLDEIGRAQLLLAAFGQVGKPYDFDFDFATDHALVCTELVWRCLRPAEQKRGIELPLVELAGRMTLPANDIARRFAEQDRANPELDFVFFIDASEKERRAFFSTEPAFRESWKRPKWDVAQR